MPLLQMLFAVALTAPAGAADRPADRPEQLSIDVLQAEIAEAERLSSRYFDVALSIDNVSSAGTAYNEADAKDHHCFLLGRMLGFGDVVAPYAVSYVPDFTTQTTENAQDLRVMSNSMANYAAVGRHVAALTKEERGLEWNLDCAAGAKVVRYATNAPRTAFFTVENEGKMLKVLGDITPGFASRLREALDANPNVETVALGSRGGAVFEALQAGRTIRSRGLTTTLWNNCLSACPLVFAGGKDRIIWSPYPNLGFHEMSDEHGQTVPQGSPAYRVLFQYLTDMGVQADVMIMLMWKAPPSGMHMVEGSNEALCAVRFTTWIQRICDTNSHVR